MKPVHLFAKGTATTLRNGKAKALGLLGGLMLAGAAMTLAAPTASAQQFGVAVQFGGPRYVAPAPRIYRPYAPGYYGPAYVAPAPVYGVGYAHADGWRAHEYWEQHRELYGRPVPYRGW